MKAKNWDVHQLLTLSSLIEEEATGFTDRQKISSVFYNRLAKGMPLQTDPTVLYALGKHKQRVLYEDLKVNSPYNTYVVKGLPVGPIANSGKHSVEAALEPAQTDYYYFLAAPTGEVYYAKTLEEHNALKQNILRKSSEMGRDSEKVAHPSFVVKYIGLKLAEESFLISKRDVQAKGKAGLYFYCILCVKRRHRGTSPCK